MAKIQVLGDAVVITSAIKLEDLRNVAKYRPEALTLKGGEDGKESIFAIAVVEGKGGVSKYGASFGTATRDDNKFATITLIERDIQGDVKEYVADKLGSILNNINKLEEALPAVIEAIKAERKTVMESISVTQ